MTQVYQSKLVSKSVCEALGIDYEKHPVTKCEINTNNEIAVIDVRFLVTPGLLAEIDAHMAKVR